MVQRRSAMPSVSGIGERGFSLIEVVIVLTLVALASTLALVYVQVKPDIMSARQDLQAAIARSRARAISENRTIDLTLLRAGARPDDTSASGDRFVLPDQVDATVVAPRRIQAGAGAGTAVLRFYPDGSTSGGMIRLKNAAGSQVRLDVDWFSGAVRVRE